MSDYLAGIALVVVGVLVAIFGDRNVDAKGGRISKALSMPRLGARFVNWAVAVLLVVVGVALLSRGGHL